ncbi:MAG: serine hydrolase, partial [Shinella sp.]
MSSSISKTLSVALAVALPVLASPLSASGQDAAPLSAEQSDPRTLGWMQGFPPPEDKIIRFSDSDYFSFPKSRWTVCHFRQLMPTTNVSRGLGAPTMLERKIDPAIDGVTFRPTGADQDMTWLQSLSANYTDGIVVLHKGVLVYEHYSGCLNEAGQHGAMSVTKSLTGLLGEVLVAEGVLDEKAKVATVVPELAQSAFGDATIRQVLDMTTGLRYSEDYA